MRRSTIAERLAKSTDITYVGYINDLGRISVMFSTKSNREEALKSMTLLNTYKIKLYTANEAYDFKEITTVEQWNELKETLIQSLAGIDIDGDHKPATLKELAEEAVKRANDNLATFSCNSFSHHELPCEGLYFDEDGYICCAHNGCPGVRCGVMDADMDLLFMYEESLCTGSMDGGHLDTTEAVKSIVNSIVASAKNQEDPRNRVIVECEIREAKGRNQVIITSNCDGWAEDKNKLLFSYYNDELSFSASEFIGLTEQQGKDLFHKRDVAYLQS